MIVLDASAILEVLLDTELGRRIHTLVWNDSHEKVNVPHLLDVEVAHVVARLVRARKLTPSVAMSMLDDLRALDMVRHSHSELLQRVLEMRDTSTAYDGVYLALAEALDARLVTSDAKLARVPAVRTKIELVR